MRIGIAGRERLIELDAEIEGKKKENEETVGVRYIFSRDAKLVKIEAMAPSGNYVKIMDRKMKGELIEGIERGHRLEMVRIEGGHELQMFMVKKEFGEGKDRIVVDCLVTTRGSLMRIDINGTDYNNFALRPTKVQRGMKEFMANNDVREWYAYAVSRSLVTQTLEEAYTLHIEARGLEGGSIRLNKPIPFAGHEIVSFRFIGNDLVTRAGPYGISVNGDNVTVSWIKGELDSEKETNILMQLNGDEIVLCEGGRHLRIVTDLVMREGKPYLKTLNSKEAEILEKEVNIKNSLLSIGDAKKVMGDRILAGRHPSLEFTNTRLSQILEHEADINQAAALYKDAWELWHNETLGKALEKHLKENTPPIEK